jgi:hypothetical protein
MAIKIAAYCWGDILRPRMFERCKDKHFILNPTNIFQKIFSFYTKKVQTLQF